MGNLCSICYPCQSAKNRNRTTRKFSETPQVIDSEGQDEGLLDAQLVSNEDQTVQTTLPTSQSLKADSFVILSSKEGGTVVGGGAGGGAAATAAPGAGTGAAGLGGTGAGARAEKKSLALKLSGSLNRNNSESRNISETKINALFEKYKDESEDSILSEGVEQFCIDLQLKPDEFKVLVLAWKFEAEVMCRFTRQEFIKGCKAMKVDSLKAIQTKLPEIVTAINNDVELFKELYRFTFKFGLDSSTGQRLLAVDMAVSLWILVFSQQEPPVLKRWIHFLDKHPQVRGIPRDTWNMFLHFVHSVGSDLTQYDDTEAWPSLFDDFVEFENDQLNQNSSAMLDLNRENSLSPS